MILTGILSVLSLSLLFYMIFGGADFGAGVLEGLVPKKLRKENEALVSKAMSPVWEANHMWIILAVVILFNGFPDLYSMISTIFHIPLLIMLFGIVLRGCAFTFRHYDPYYEYGQPAYRLTFFISSFLAPLMLGMIGGSMMNHHLTDPLSSDLMQNFQGHFWDLYGASWLSGFSTICGFILVFLCALIASVFLFCESTHNDLKSLFYSYTKWFLLGLYALICALLLMSWIQNNLFYQIFKENIALVLLLPAWFILSGVLLNSLRKNRILILRVAVSGKAVLISAAWMLTQFPYAMPGLMQNNQKAFDLLKHHASPETLNQLWYALLFGSFLIFPALFFLFRTFKSSQSSL